MTANVKLGWPKAFARDPLAFHGAGGIILNLDNGDAIMIGSPDDLSQWVRFFGSDPDYLKGGAISDRAERTKAATEVVLENIRKKTKLTVRCRQIDEEHELTYLHHHANVTFWKSSTNGQNRFWFNNGGGAYTDDSGVDYTYADTLKDAENFAIMIEIGRSIERKKMSRGEGSK